MQSDRHITRNRSVYSLGAADGLWVGLSMGLCVMCMVLSARIEALSVVGLVLLIFTPFLAWRFQRRAWIRKEVPTSFSAVWLHGICIFLFGSILMALFMYISLKYIVPGWIELQMERAIVNLSADTSTAEQARILNNIVQTGQLPSPIYTSISSIWLTAFTGSMWSMIFAFILTRTQRYRKMRNETDLLKR